MPHAHSKLGDYEIVSKIGSGSYGTCQKIRRKRDGKILVWKELNYGCMTDAEKKLLVLEVNLLRQLKHDHIVRYYDRIIDKERSKIYIVMEHCQGGDLAQLIHKHKTARKSFDEVFIWKVLWQLSLALQECHERKSEECILHRDIKPANVFRDHYGNLKLGDFGLARVLSSDKSFAHTFVGTPYYMSPEQVCKTSYNEKSDIWSLGCLLYELCAFTPPFQAKSQVELTRKIQDGRYRPIPSNYSHELTTIISRMLQRDDEKRPSINQILNMPQLIIFQQFGSSLVREGKTLDQKRQILQQKEEELRIREIALQQKEVEFQKKEHGLWLLNKETDKKVDRIERYNHKHKPLSEVEDEINNNLMYLPLQRIPDDVNKHRKYHEHKTDYTNKGNCVLIKSEIPIQRHYGTDRKRIANWDYRDDVKISAIQNYLQNARY